MFSFFLSILPDIVVDTGIVLEGLDKYFVGVIKKQKFIAKQLINAAMSS